MLTFLPLTTLQVQSPHSTLEFEDRAHENLENPHPSACSLKFRYKNLEDRHPNARSLKKHTVMWVPWRNMWKKLSNVCSLKKYVKEIKGEVEIEGLFYTNILLVSRI